MDNNAQKIKAFSDALDAMPGKSKAAKIRDLAASLTARTGKEFTFSQVENWTRPGGYGVRDCFVPDVAALLNVAPDKIAPHLYGGGCPNYCPKCGEPLNHQGQGRAA